MDFIKFEGPAEYLIVTKGSVSKTLPFLLDFAEITPISEDEMVKTAIKVIVKDQAHLSGILSYLYDEHLSIIKVVYLGSLESNYKTDMLIN